MEWLKQQFRRKEEGFIFHKKNKGGTFLRLKNYKIYPGHGEPTSLDAERNSLIRWAQAI